MILLYVEKYFFGGNHNENYDKKFQKGKKYGKQAEKTLENIVKSPTEPLFKFLEENEEVFSGDLTYKINKLFAESFTIGSAMRLEDEKINGMPSSFDMHF